MERKVVTTSELLLLYLAILFPQNKTYILIFLYILWDCLRGYTKEVHGGIWTVFIYFLPRGSNFQWGYSSSSVLLLPGLGHYSPH